MIVLGLDTAQAACSAALACKGETLAELSEEMETGHAEALAPMIETLLSRARLSPGALGRIGCTVGPGTFTGLRVALSLARAMGLALSIPVLGVTTLEALAAAAFRLAPAADYAAAAMDARRGELYFQIFGKALAPAAEPEILAFDDALARLSALAGARVALAGTGANLLADRARGSSFLLAGIRFPAAADVARIAAAAQDAALRPPEPLYLRAPGAKLPAAARPLRPPRPRR
jgi:tRNA threonylcarbamoyladenosine biosynthesis protein TsaB